MLIVREKSKIIVDLLNDEQKIDEERKKAQEMRERVGGKPFLPQDLT